MQYDDIISDSPCQAYYDFDADTGVTCGHIQLAMAASSAFKSPVYLGVNYHVRCKLLLCAGGGGLA